MTRNVTIALSDELHEKMKKFQEIRWSEIVRQSIEERINMLEEVEKIAAKSKLTEEDVRAFSKKIKSLASKRFMNAHRS